jgi:hypothetical protein
MAILGLGGVGEARAQALSGSTLALTDANPQITFEDSGASTTPQWSIQTINSLVDPGTSHFGIQDLQSGLLVVRIQGNVANAALAIEVDDEGKIKFGNDSVIVDPFNRRLGIGTQVPQGDIHVAGGLNQDIFAGLGPDLVTGPALNFGYAGASFGRGAGFFNARPDAQAVAPNPSLRFATANVVRMIIDNQGYVGLGVANPTVPIHLASGAFVSIGGVWTNASSREYKQDLESLTPDEARATLAGLDPVKFAYRSDPAERHVGFVAEDVPTLVATADRKGLSPMDIVAVLTRVVQDQQRALEEERRATQAALADLRAELSILRQALGR